LRVREFQTHAKLPEHSDNLGNLGQKRITRFRRDQSSLVSFDEFPLKVAGGTT
jgi:hypothetical protein